MKITLIGGPLDGDVREVEELKPEMDFMSPPYQTLAGSLMESRDRCTYRLSVMERSIAMMNDRPPRYVYAGSS